jgi:hypothetical protein
MWQQIIVALIVLAAWRTSAPSTCRRPAPPDGRRAGRRGYDEARMAKIFNIKSGCGDDTGCSSCGSCDSAPPAKSDALKRVIKLHVQR